MAAATKEGRSAITDDRDLSRLEAKLDTLIGLVALGAAPDSLSLKERAVRLQRVGMTPKDIAALCGTTPAAVSQTLYDAKRETKGKKKTTK